MRFKFLDVLSILCALIILAGCRPIAPPTLLPPTPAPDKEICPTDAQATCRLTGDNEALREVPQKLLDKDPDLGNRACESLMDVDLLRTYDRFPSAIFWTFHLNFREFVDEQHSLPIACLKFYWRDNQKVTVGRTKPGSFVESEHNTVLIPCSIVADQKEDVSFGKELIKLKSSLGERPNVDANSAKFLKGGHIECPVDIRLSAHTLIQSPEFDSDVKSIGLKSTDIMSITQEAQEIYTNPTRQYDFFTVAAAVASLSAQSDQSSYPLIYYEPHLLCQATFGATCGKVTEFSVTKVKKGLSFATTLDGTQYAPNDPETPACPESCMIDSFLKADESIAHYLWDDLGTLLPPFDDSNINNRCIKQNIKDYYYLQFAWESPNGGLKTCSNMNLTPEIQQGSIQFWMGPATIYIGYRPDTQAHLEGKLYEIWVDPDSGAPPTKPTQKP